MTIDQAIQKCAEHGWTLSGLQRIGSTGNRRWVACLESTEDRTIRALPTVSSYTHYAGFKDGGFDTATQAILAALDFAIAHPPTSNKELSLAAAIDSLTKVLRHAAG